MTSGVFPTQARREKYTAGQPLTLQIGTRYYADKPTNGPDWGVRFAVTFLFPK